MTVDCAWSAVAMKYTFETERYAVLEPITRSFCFGHHGPRTRVQIFFDNVPCWKMTIWGLYVRESGRSNGSHVIWASRAAA